MKFIKYTQTHAHVMRHQIDFRTNSKVIIFNVPAFALSLSLGLISCLSLL